MSDTQLKTFEVFHQSKRGEPHMHVGAVHAPDAELALQYAPQILRLGLSIPDPELRYDEQEKRWHYGEPDWEEFRRVIAGQGPMNAERLAVRRAAHEEGLWVREALAAKAMINVQ